MADRRYSSWECLPNAAARVLPTFFRQHLTYPRFGRLQNLRFAEETAPAPGGLPTKGPKLTVGFKGLLRTLVGGRSAEDRNYIYRVIGNLTALQRYPEKVRENLTASSTFVYQGPGKILVKEGQPPWNMYFILSGHVSVTKMMYDAGDKLAKPFQVATMSAGDFFGEINILHGEPWPTTIATLTHTEFLSVGKWHFQRILEQFLGEQKEEITRCLNTFSYFKDWSSRTVLECCILSRVQQFPKDELILGDRVGNYRSAYFIVSGECAVMYHLIAEIDQRDSTEAIHKVFEVHEEDTFPVSRLLRGLQRERMCKTGEPHLIHLIINQTLEKLINELPLPESRTLIEGKKNREISLQSHFFKVAVLMPGQCFGIGESLEDKFILSNSDPVVLLEIPRHFLKMHNRGNIWGRVREFFNVTYPSPQEVFNKYVTERKWQACRKRYMESVLNVNRPFTGLTAAEQPYYFRLFEDILNPMFRHVRRAEMNDEPGPKE